MLSQPFMFSNVKSHPPIFKINEKDTENEKISISLCQCFICKFVLSYKEKKIINVNNICRSNINITVSEHRGIYDAEANILVKGNI